MNHPLPSHTRIPGPSTILCSGAQNEKGAPSLDAVFYVLGNYHRRKLFEILCHNEYLISELCELTYNKYQSTRKQLITLEAYGLISSYKDGRERYYHATATALRHLKTWSNVMDTLLRNLN